MIGDTAPDFTLKDQHGKEFHLYGELVKKIMLVFYPKDDSLVCTRQLKEYHENSKKFSDAGIKIIGINIGTIHSHKQFSEKCKLDFPLLIDSGKIVSKKYHALNFMRINKRKIIIINTDKKIVFEKVNFSLNYIGSEEILNLLN